MVVLWVTVIGLGYVIPSEIRLITVHYNYRFCLVNGREYIVRQAIGHCSGWVGVNVVVVRYTVGERLQMLA